MAANLSASLRAYLRRMTDTGDGWPPPKPQRPVYAIGDIHGRDDLLEALLPIIEAHRRSQNRPDCDMVFLGDAVDRGMDSAAVLRRIRQMTENDPESCHCLLGNHEDMLLRFLDGPGRADPRWLRIGGAATIQSFVGTTAPLPQRPGSAGEEALAPLRRQLEAAIEPDLLAWLRARPLSWRSGDLVAAHAGLDPGRPPDDQAEQDLLWGHDDFGVRPRSDGLWVVHGHTIMEEPFAAAGQIATDTGAWFTERLTAAYIAPDAPVAFLQTG